MSRSGHPVIGALRRRVDGPARLVATVMALPLVDGVFAAMVLAGVLDSAAGLLQVGLLVFGGSATFAVVVMETDATGLDLLGPVLAVGVLVIAGAAVEAALAPMVVAAIDVGLFRYFAALVLLAVAARTASAQVARIMPRPAAILLVGLAVSVRPAAFEVIVNPDVDLVARAALAATIGVGFALASAVLKEPLQRRVDLDRFRFGSAVALGVLALSVSGLLPADSPLSAAVLAVAGLLAFDPRGAAPTEPPEDESDGPEDLGTGTSAPIESGAR